MARTYVLSITAVTAFFALVMSACAGADAVDGMQSTLGFALILGPTLRLFVTRRSADGIG